MSKYSHKKMFYIDSRTRVDGTNDDFLFKIEIPPDHVGFYSHVAVVSGTIPKSYYLISAPFNTFTLEEDDGVGGAVQVPITVPVGNYRRSSWQYTLKNLLNTNSPYGWVYDVIYPTGRTEPTTGKFTFTVELAGGGSPPNQPSLIIDDMYEQIGFNVGTHTFAGDQLVAQNVMKLQLEDNLIVHSDIVAEGDILHDFHSSSQPSLGNIRFINPDIDATAKPMRTGGNGVYRFSLTDEEGKKINLNGVNWVMTLVLFKYA